MAATPDEPNCRRSKARVRSLVHFLKMENILPTPFKTQNCFEEA